MELAAYDMLPYSLKPGGGLLGALIGECPGCTRGITSEFPPVPAMIIWAGLLPDTPTVGTEMSTLIRAFFLTKRRGGRHHPACLFWRQVRSRVSSDRKATTIWPIMAGPSVHLPGGNAGQHSPSRIIDLIFHLKKGNVTVRARGFRSASEAIDRRWNIRPGIFCLPPMHLSNCSHRRQISSATRPAEYKRSKIRQANIRFDRSLWRATLASADPRNLILSRCWSWLKRSSASSSVLDVHVWFLVHLSQGRRSSALDHLPSVLESVQASWLPPKVIIPITDHRPHNPGIIPRTSHFRKITRIPPILIADRPPRTSSRRSDPSC